MALTDPYLTVDAFKLRIGLTAADQDTALEQTLKAASRQIDNWCGRTFNKSDAGTVKYFSARNAGFLDLGDTVSVAELATDTTGLRTYETVWDAVDYDLFPFDAADWSLPYSRLQSSTLGLLALPFLPRGVRVTGQFGWPAVPDVIAEATALQANRLWARKNAPFGIVGSGELGQAVAITSLDPDVKSMLAPYRAIAF